MPELVLIRTRHDVLPERLTLLRVSRRWPLAASLLALAAHAAVAYSLAQAAQVAPPVALAEPFEVVQIDPPTPPPPLAAPPPTPPLPAAEAPPRSAKAAAPAPAAAAAAMTQTTPPEQPVDFSDELVIGSATSYEGGTTAAGHVKAPPSPIARGPATSAAGSATSRGAGQLDRSRAASVIGGLDWRCPFPEEANVAGVDRALAKIRVEIDAAGHVRNVALVHDPGHGFGRAAERCARGKRFHAALDRSGRAVPTQVAVGVRFVR